MQGHAEAALEKKARKIVEKKARKIADAYVGGGVPSTCKS